MIRLLLALLFLSGCMSYHRGPLPGEPAKARFMNVAGARVRYIDRGKGSPVVLLHGFASSLDSWSEVAAELSQRHRVVALDLKGFGWTDRPEGDYSPAAQAALVAALLDRLAIPRAAVVAHSWGASVALRLALDRPARVSRLALYSAWVYEEQLPTAFLWARAPGVGEVIFGLFYDERRDEKLALAFYDPRFVTEERVERVAALMDRPGSTAAALAAVRGQRYAEIEKRYRRIAQPALLLWGRDDRVSPLAYGERLANELRDARLVVYPRCGHFPMIEAKAPSTRDLAAFLAEDRPRRPKPSRPKPRRPTPKDAATPPPPADPPPPAETPDEPQPETPYDAEAP